MTLRARVMNASSVSVVTFDTGMRNTPTSYGSATGLIAYDAGAAQTGWFLRFAAFRDGGGSAEDNKMVDYSASVLVCWPKETGHA